MSGGLLLAKSIASLSFDTTVHVSKPSSCIEASTSKAVKYSSSTIRARRDEMSSAISQLPLAAFPVSRIGKRYTSNIGSGRLEALKASRQGAPSLLHDPPARAALAQPNPEAICRE